MEMNRRRFLKLFASAAPVAAVAPAYFFAPVGGWHSDVIANPYSDRFDRAMEILDAYMERVKFGVMLETPQRMFWVNREGIWSDEGQGPRIITESVRRDEYYRGMVGRGDAQWS